MRMTYNIVVGSDPRVHLCARDCSEYVPGAGSGRNYALCESNIFVPWDPRRCSFTNTYVTCVFCLVGMSTGFAAIDGDVASAIRAADAAVRGLS